MGSSVHEIVAQAHEGIGGRPVRNTIPQKVIREGTEDHVVDVLEHDVHFVPPRRAPHFQHPKATLHGQNHEAAGEHLGAMRIILSRFLVY